MLRPTLFANYASFRKNEEDVSDRSSRCVFLVKNSLIGETMRKIICTLAITFLATTIAQANWATLEGQFLFGDKDTKLPKVNKLQPTKDLEVCGKEDLFDEKLVINQKNRGLANVVLWAYKPKAVHSDFAKQTGKVTIANVMCRFEPRVIALSTKQTLEVANPDPVAHNAMIRFLKNPEVNPLIPAFGKIDLKLKKTEIIPCTISCAIHPWMQGKILVQDHPYMAVTDKDGNFKLSNLPAGKLTLKVWHEACGWIKSAEIDNKPATWKKGKYQLDLKPGAKEKHTYQLDAKLFSKK